MYELSKPNIINTKLIASDEMKLDESIKDKKDLKDQNTLEDIKIFWYTPFGNHAFKNNSSSLTPHKGTFDACLYTTVFHAKMFGTAALKTWLKGKFHGAIQ